MDLKRDLLQNIQRLRAETPHLVQVIAIDGPTASGKTTLADGLAEELKRASVPSWIFRVDWTLAARADRARDLEVLKKDGRPFPYEAELHMRLGGAREFLAQVAAFNQTISEDPGPQSRVVELRDLYAREKGGDLSGEARLTLRAGMVIFVEGHYTLRNELDEMIDLQILLLASPEELLRRKVNRVKGYRGAEDATDYFWRIDLPSFRHHLARFGANADLVVDNTSWHEPRLLSVEEQSGWMTRAVAASPLTAMAPHENLAERVFSRSSLVPEVLKNCFHEALGMMKSWDSHVGRYLRTAIGEIRSDLGELAVEAVKAMNEKMTGGDYRFHLTYSDSLYNVYYRKLPLTLGIAIVDGKDKTEVALLAEVDHECLHVHVFWRGDYQCLTFRRKLGQITSAPPSADLAAGASGAFVTSSKTPLRVMLSSKFTVPSFLRDFDYHPVYVGREGENLSTPRAVVSMLEMGGVWIHRFALFSEIKFFRFVLDCCGASSLQVGNYLIAVRHSAPELRAKFKSFAEGWRTPISQRALFAEAQADSDRIIHDERREAREFVERHCPSFRLNDGYLFSQFMYGDESRINTAMHELGQMLRSPLRMVRKRATQFIIEYFPGFTMQSAQLWKDLPKEAAKDISLESYLLLSPTMLGEVYLWLALRDDQSALLATNIYDIRDQSLDCQAYLAAAAHFRRPVILQSSLNALGQKETEAGKQWFGYLQPNNGALDFVQAGLRAARDLLLTKGIEPPLFSLGLDHVNYENDHPRGRAKRFFQHLLPWRGVTHLVLDGSALFSAQTRDRRSLWESYDRIADYAASLIDNVRETYLIDLEICAGEFNYVANEQQAFVPPVEEMRLFMRCFQEKLAARGIAALLARPMLFAANLGTTHHGEDKEEPQVETSKSWRDGMKNENFISGVLHGTTKSHRNVLARATVGCHKVNIAGDLLETIVQNLPERVFRKVKEAGKEQKKALASVREDMNAFTDEQNDRVRRALMRHCIDLMDAINSPKLSSMDESYFRYIPYRYSEEHIQVVLNGVRERIKQSAQSTPRRRADARVGHHFSASMIEVPTEEVNGQLSEMLWHEGVRYFHIDVGDGRFISRSFSGLEKARHLRKKFPDAILHAHLMVDAPGQSQNGELPIIQQYAEAGVSAIAIHPRSVGNRAQVLAALKFIRNLKCRPGIIIETSDTMSESLKALITEANLDWAVVMGVPVGYGGQIFQYTTISRIASLHEFVTSQKRDFLIEVDGGLNLDNLRLCRNAGAQVFAGWSLIKDASPPNIALKLRAVQATIEEDGQTKDVRPLRTAA